MMNGLTPEEVRLIVAQELDGNPFIRALETKIEIVVKELSELKEAVLGE